jgi:hypothetical protein
MKPLLSAPLTEEDHDCWVLVMERFLPGLGLAIASSNSDRRDADLMYCAQKHPLVTAHIQEGGEHCEVRGFLTSMRRVGWSQ